MFFYYSTLNLWITFSRGREDSTWIFVQGASEFLLMPLRATQHLMPNVIAEMQNLQSQSNFFAKPVCL